MYPCGCTPAVIEDPGPCPSGNCLKLPNLTIDPLTSVLPCGGSMNIDIGQYADFSKAVGTINWSITGFDATIFENMAISNAGVVTGSTTSAAQAHVDDWYEIVVMAADSGSLLSVKRVIKLSIKNACLNKVCASGSTCNPCTGLCVEGVPDLILT